MAYNYDFIEACENHSNCYHKCCFNQCGEAKSKCDLIFYNELKSLCQINIFVDPEEVSDSTGRRFLESISDPQMKEMDRLGQSQMDPLLDTVVFAPPGLACVV